MIVQCGPDVIVATPSEQDTNLSGHGDCGQKLCIRPVLNRRFDRVLAGETPPRSRAHFGYIAAEVVKTVPLLASGVLALSSV